MNGKTDKYITSFLVISCGDIKIEQLEEITFTDKKELLIREGFYITSLNSVNKCVVGRPIEETRRLYKLMNYEKILTQKNIKHVCKSCGGFYTQCNYSHHIKTLKHLNVNSFFLNNQNPIINSCDYTIMVN